MLRARVTFFQPAHRSWIARERESPAMEYERELAPPIEVNLGQTTTISDKNIGGLLKIKVSSSIIRLFGDERELKLFKGVPEEKEASQRKMSTPGQDLTDMVRVHHREGVYIKLKPNKHSGILFIGPGDNRLRVTYFEEEQQSVIEPSNTSMAKNSNVKMGLDLDDPLNQQMALDL